MIIFIYIFSLVLANLLVSYFGPWFSPINAFVLIGLDFVLRDKLHEKWEHNKLVLKMGLLIASTSLISYAINPASGKIAIASFSAFFAAMLIDSIVFHLLKKYSWAIRSNGSNVAGAAVDSVVFPYLAFGSLMPEIVTLQFLAKIIGGFVWVFLINKQKKVIE